MKIIFFISIFLMLLPNLSPAQIVSTGLNKTENGFKSYYEYFSSVGNAVLHKSTVAYIENEIGFEEVYSYNLGSYFCENNFSVLDFDNDGDQDIILLATASDTTPALWKSKEVLLRNDGNWVFTESVLATYGTYGYELTTADFNNDGWIDYASVLEDSVYIKLNDQSGGFTRGWAHDLWSHFAMEIVDINGDNFVDLIYGGLNGFGAGSFLSVYLNADSGRSFSNSWHSEFYGSSSSYISGVKSANLNNDAYIDFVATQFQDGLLLGFTGDGTGFSFTANVLKNNESTARGLAIADINGDQLSDMAVSLGSRILDVYKPFTSDSVSTVWTSPNLGATALNISFDDFNLDGFPDIFIGNFTGGRMAIYENQAGSSFDLIWDESLAGNGYMGKTFDMNSDGYPDLIVGEENELHVLLFDPDFVSIDDTKILNAPKDFSLSFNFPNPFNPVTSIRYSLPKSDDVTLIIYNLSGGEVARLINGYKPAGEYRIEWNASNFASGIYFYRLQAGDFVRTRKMVLLK